MDERTPSSDPPEASGQDAAAAVSDRAAAPNPKRWGRGRWSLLIAAAVVVVALVVGVVVVHVSADRAAATFRTTLAARIDKLYGKNTTTVDQQNDILAEPAPKLSAIPLGSALSPSYASASRARERYIEIRADFLPAARDYAAVSSFTDVAKALSTVPELDIDDLVMDLTTESEVSAASKTVAAYRKEAKAYANVASMLTTQRFRSSTLEAERKSLITNLTAASADYFTLASDVRKAAASAKSAFADGDTAGAVKGYEATEKVTAQVEDVSDRAATSVNSSAETLEKMANKIIKGDLMSTSYTTAEKYSKKMHALRKTL